MRRALPLVALILAGFMVALVMSEGLARLGWGLASTPPARPTPPAGLRELKSVFDLATPNIRGVYNGALYQANSAGFRGREYTELPPSGVFRIVVVGDSITMGSGVLAEEAYSALVEAALNARGKQARYEVLNLGISGANIHHVADRLGTMGLRFHPNLIVYGFTLNDIEGPAYRSLDAETAARRERYLRFPQSGSYLVRVLGPRWLTLSDVLFPGPGSYSYDLDQNYFHNPQAWRDFLAGLDQLTAIQKSRGICVHVLIHTQIYYLNFLHPFTKIYDRVAAAAAERGLTVTQSFPLFRSQDENALKVGVFDPHPNAAGHRILARALLEGLRTLPPHCWDTAGALRASPFVERIR
jgi:lysophospholipase L1-like esterase